MVEVAVLPYKRKPARGHVTRQYNGVVDYDRAPAFECRESGCYNCTAILEATEVVSEGLDDDAERFLVELKSFHSKERRRRKMELYSAFPRTTSAATWSA